MQSFFVFAGLLFRCSAVNLLVVLALFGAPGSRAAPAQSRSGGCVLKDHVYTCDGAAFQKAFTAAKAVAIQTHNADGVARNQLTALLTGKFGKTIASPDVPPNLTFLLIPIDQAGNINASPGDLDLGTLRVYSAAPDGTPTQLLWAETFSGPPDMPWPAVVRGLLLKFQSHFHGVGK